MVFDFWSKISLADVLLKIVTPVAGMVLVWWKGGFKWLFSAVRRQLALRHYRAALRADVSKVPIIGKKEGFDLASVYTPIETSRSDLMPAAPEQRYRRPSVYVLVGAPGGGKSTFVKNLLLDSLRAKRQRMPLFFRLRDFDKKHSIEELIVRRVETMGVKNAAELVHAELQSANVSCVLDGLDEVRPHLVNDAYDAINAFYTTYFAQGFQKELIVTCRKEAYRNLPLSIPDIWEVLPLNDEQIQAFAKNWPLTYPHNRSAEDFWNDLSASEKILEVSRSPLLLVGGLLLYTESGLGIPGHRIKYLDRIKQTLIEDWAIAQGQPPDPLRDAYTPVLTAIALEMHSRAIPELRREECLKLLEEFLPSVGHLSSTAPEFLDSIFRRTGILVRDTPGFVIFVQFTLQEYFASLAMINKLSATEIAALEPKPWWREAILFVAAQIPDPSKLIEALMDTAPMIGALAVAEAPTPSLRLQRDAIDRALRQLDAGDGAAMPALVALLRKAAPSLASDLAQALEERVEQESDLAANASLILASAGTDVATEALSRHPRSWQDCLKNPRLMSGKFEAKLADWVSVADHPHWTEAADMLVQLSTIQTASKLEKLLSSLPAGRAGDLAVKALRQFREEEPASPWGEVSSRQCAAVCVALANIGDVDHALSVVSTAEIPERSAFSDSPGLIRTSLELSRAKGWSGDNAKSKMFRTIREAVNFATHSQQYLILFASSLLTFGLFGHFGLHLALGTCAVVSLLLVIAASRPFASLPWARRNYRTFGSAHARPAAMLLLFGVVITASMFTDVDTPATMHAPSAAFAILAAICVSLFAPIFALNLRAVGHFELGMRDMARVLELRIITTFWISYLVLAFGLLLSIGHLIGLYIKMLTLAFAIAVVLWSLYRLLIMYSCSRALLRAADQVKAVPNTANATP